MTVVVRDPVDDLKHRLRMTNRASAIPALEAAVASADAHAEVVDAAARAERAALLYAQESGVSYRELAKALERAPSWVYKQMVLAKQERDEVA